MEITNSTMGSFIFTVEPSPQIGKGLMGFNMPMVSLVLLSFLCRALTLLCFAAKMGSPLDERDTKSEAVQL